MKITQNKDDWSPKNRPIVNYPSNPDVERDSRWTQLQHLLIQGWLLIALGSLFYASAEAQTATAPWAEQPAKLALKDTSAPLSLDSASNHTPSHSWALVIDNDLFVPGERDQDYTFGVNLSQSHAGLATASLTLNRPLQALDKLFGVDTLASTQMRYSRELGVYAFTPEDISQAAAIADDRPYASLIYLSTTHERINSLNNSAIKSSLTVGLLGTDLPSKLQQEVHRYTDSTPAQGWDNQISDGGELTARYQLAYQQQLNTGSANFEVKSTSQVSLGYLTEASWGLSFRKGLINSAWTSFNPELTSYGEKAAFDSNNKRVFEHYVWGGFALKARGYNAFMEGQWRDSAVTYDRSQLNSVLVEGWLGYTLAFNNGYRMSYVLRGHSSEVRHGQGNRDLLWGSLILARAI